MENALDLARHPPGTVSPHFPDAANTLTTLCDIGRTRADTPHLKRELRGRDDFGHIVGNSNPMRRLYEQVRHRLCPLPVNRFRV